MLWQQYQAYAVGVFGAKPCGSPVQKRAQSGYYHGLDDRVILINEFDREPIRILNKAICLAS
ncbi:MAG: hypothetical protein C5S45_08245 [Candidatus Methanocomedens sp.]|nr:MAG: hypothetical protein C5S45_08245 [ANME-2 cluster archaeon]